MSSRTRSRFTVLLVALLAPAAVGLGACASTGGRRAPAAAAAGATAAAADDAEPDVTVTVHNDNFADLDVRLFRYGVSTMRLGVVTANTTRRFVFAAALTRSSDMTIVAAPLGDADATAATSGPIMMRPGQRIDFTVGMRLWQSILVVR